MEPLHPVVVTTMHQMLQGALGLPADLVEDAIVHFNLRELQILAEIDEYAELAHEELEARLRRLFRKFELPYQETRTMMHVLETIISGSSALFIASPGNFYPGDIDFYTPIGNLSTVVDYFLRQGYVVEPWTSRPPITSGDTNTEIGLPVVPTPRLENAAEPYEAQVVANIALLRKGGADGLTLNVVESRLPCAEAPVFCFHSTVVMNIVSSTGVISYFPDWTFANKGVINRAGGTVDWKTRGSIRSRAALDKYAARGYDIREGCDQWHQVGQMACGCCGGRRTWDEGLAMTFRRGDKFSPAGRIFEWRLGQGAGERDKLCWRDRGSVIVVQGEGDGRAHVYDGLAKQGRMVTEAELQDYV